MFIIHLDETDFANMRGIQLVAQVVCDLTHFQQLVLTARLVWVSTLPQRVWWVAWRGAAIDKTRHNINREVGRRGRGVIKQSRIVFRSPQLFCSDGIHILEQGCYIYLENLADHFGSII